MIKKRLMELEYLMAIRPVICVLNQVQRQPSPLLLVRLFKQDLWYKA